MYQQLLLPIDISDPPSWQGPLTTAVAYAQSFGAKLCLLVVIPNVSMPLVDSFFPEDFEKKAHAAAVRALDEFAAEHIPDGIDITTLVVTGRIYEEILAVADKIDCDLIIMGRSGQTHSSFLLGTNAARVVSHATRSVLVVS